ncbi:MAG: type II toxin-antitoxin system VapB family antitoxin [Thiohalocapsa sp.]|jgi:Arc/MetJ family transcription regulator|uniref:type II toxin-antitoxin system VapB family antitoxin n=1 Tax=Thiohalocapsa sp. TaxID=2497641 RepID=UPI0025F3F965|nr:type II toxin-antitoxin system VapB family antitoxin [Thiohalocapsa sp.]MCG6939894.1 type II toxin-antitoxin system VapB family antitoxin [Thiohalocapsa sp.]
MRTNIVLDEDLVKEAMAITGAKTKREVVDRALREMIARAKRLDLMDLYGSDGIDPAYDYKRARAGDE